LSNVKWLNGDFDRENVGTRDEWERPGILYKLSQVTPHLPRESQIRIQREQARLGLISHDDYKKVLIGYGKFTTEEIDATEEQSMVFTQLLCELPGKEQREILNEILGLDI